MAGEMSDPAASSPGEAGARGGSILARAVSLNVAGRVGYLAVGFVGSIALARLLGPAGRGLLALMLSLSSVAIVLTTFGIPLAVIYFSSRSDADHGALLGNSLLQATITAAVLIPLAAIFHQQLADTFGAGHGGRTWILAAALVPVTFLDWAIHGQLQGMLRFGRLNLLLVLSNVAFLAVVLLLIGALGIGVAGGILATAAGSIVMIAGSAGPVLRKGRPRLSAVLARRTLHYGIRVQVGSVFQLANGRFDVIVLQFFRPLRQVGYYVVAQVIAELVINLANAFQQTLLPLMSGRDQGDDGEAMTIVSIRHHSSLSFVAVVANAVIGTGIILFGYGPQFHRAVGPMLVLLPGIWFLGLGIVIQGDLAGRGRPGLSSALAGLSAAVTVVMDFALVPPFGVMGAALASVLAYTTFGVASILALRRISGVALRSLLLPTHADLQLYRTAAHRALAVARGRLRRRAQKPGVQ